MRILHLIQRYHPGRGGAEIHLHTISRFLVQSGHQVLVATSDALDFELFWDPDRRRIEEQRGAIDGVEIVRFPVRHLPLSQLAYPAIRRLLWLLSLSGIGPVSLMAQLSKFTPWLPDLNRYLSGEAGRFDLVAGMTISFEPILAAGRSIARRQGIPFVCYPLTHLGAGDRPGHDQVSRFYTMRHQVDIVKSADALIAQTQAEKEFFSQKGMQPERIHVVGPGVSPDQVAGGDASRFRRQHEIQGPLVLSIGTMAYDKGIQTTVEAVRLLWQGGIEVELALIGSILAPFQLFLDRLPAEDRRRIHVLGPVDDNEKRDALAAATMLSLPSRTDSFGIAYLEAWLSGLPVIGAHTWGVMDVIDHGHDGLLVPFGDTAALAQAIGRLLEDPEEAAIMGKLGRQKVLREHIWDPKCQRILDIYQQLSAG